MNSSDITSLDHFMSTARIHSQVIVRKEINLFIKPDQCILQLQASEPCLKLFDCYAGQAEHYSFIGFDPIARIKSTQQVTTIEYQHQLNKTTVDLFTLIREFQQKLKPASDHPASRLTGAAVGLFSYNAVRHIETLPTRHTNTHNLPDISIDFYRFGIYFDYATQTIHLSKFVEISENPEKDYENALSDIENLQKKIKTPKIFTKTKLNHKNYAPIEVDLSDEEFVEKVNSAKQHIQQGDVFQLVLSRTFKKQFFHNPIKLYQQLLTNNPSPYHFYSQDRDFILVGASPEKMICVKNGHITSSPLAGTRAKNDKPTAELITELLNDDKERAEHLMLVDLARNDVGRVAKPGSVEVTRLTYPLILKNIIHLASDVTGQLQENFDVIDALKASFPAGTLSGAPKVRAMQIIDELEVTDRGFYGGCFFVIDHDNNLDSCIIIRSALIKNNHITVRTGCGIVYDSIPKSEADETRHKASALLKAIDACEQE